MAPGRKETEGIDINRMMKTFEGRWIFVPILVAVATIAAVGLFATLLKLDSLPTWAYSAPAVPTVGAYYVFQIRKLWHTDIKIDLSRTENHTATSQTVKGSAAPVIQGNNNVVNMHVLQETKPPQVAPIAAPTKPAAVDFAVKLEEKVQREQGPSSLLETELEVDGGDHHALPLLLSQGDIVQGTILADAPIYAYLMSERAYLQYWKGRDPGSAKVLIHDDSTANVRWTCPKAGKWYLVLDAYRKQSSRWAKISLQKTAASPTVV